jgi:hypothetical protein
MDTSTPRRARVKPARTVHLLTPPSDVSGFTVIVIAVGPAEDTNHVTPITSDFGAAYRVEKVSDPELPTYEVCLEGKGGHCGCKGFFRWGSCRHVEALHALRAAGKL